MRVGLNAWKVMLDECNGAESARPSLPMCSTRNYFGSVGSQTRRNNLPPLNTAQKEEVGLALAMSSWFSDALDQATRGSVKFRGRSQSGALRRETPAALRVVD
jgi:hypothetical protein